MMEPHMIDFVELASPVENYILIVFVIVVNHVGFIIFSLVPIRIIRKIHPLFHS
jgi:hypothetical protein